MRRTNARTKEEFFFTMGIVLNVVLSSFLCIMLSPGWWLEYYRMVLVI